MSEMTQAWHPQIFAADWEFITGRPLPPFSRGADVQHHDGSAEFTLRSLLRLNPDIRIFLLVMNEFHSASMPADTGKYLDAIQASNFDDPYVEQIVQGIIAFCGMVYHKLSAASPAPRPPQTGEVRREIGHLFFARSAGENDSFCATACSVFLFQDGKPLIGGLAGLRSPIHIGDGRWRSVLSVAFDPEIGPREDDAIGFGQKWRQAAALIADASGIDAIARDLQIQSAVGESSVESWGGLPVRRISLWMEGKITFRSRWGRLEAKGVFLEAQAFSSKEATVVLPKITSEGLEIISEMILVVEQALGA